MKKQVTGENTGKKCKNPTHNFPKDSHKEFCKRCLKYNEKCPKTGGLPTTLCEL